MTYQLFLSEMSIFVTGGAGYVGSHCVLELLVNNYDVIVIDNMVNCVKLEGKPLPESLIQVERLSNRKLKQFIDGDINDEKIIEKVFAENKIDVVMHFAALKSVAESVAKPLTYYQNNVSATLKLLQAMKKYGINKFIYSSSATVYGEPQTLPIDENSPTGQNCTNPYGKSKFMVEEILKDLCYSSPDWTVISLRYFNPVGAHSSGDIGEDPQEIPNNLMPYVTQVGVGLRPELKVFGNDYKTIDGTGVRDYIHIEDLSNGHLAALKQIMSQNCKGFNAINLGTGRGYSVLEVNNYFLSSYFHNMRKKLMNVFSLKIVEKYIIICFHKKFKKV